MPNRLLLVPPPALWGTLRPQLVSRAAWARSVTGFTPSCRAACCASGQSACANAACCALLGQALALAGLLPVADVPVVFVAAAEAMGVPAVARAPAVPAVAP